MAQVTLHRASRLLILIDEKIKSTAPRPTMKLSVFADDPSGKIGDAIRACQESAGTIRRLLDVRTRIKTQVGIANAKVGITKLLAEKAAHLEYAKILEQLPGVLPAAERKPDEDVYFSRRGKKAPVPSVVDRNAVVALVGATRDRYSSADSAVEAEIEIATVDAKAASDFRLAAETARRSANKVGDETYDINARNYVELSDADLDWLSSINVD